MTKKPLLIGEAPSRKGTGSPFTGPSGARIARLIEVDPRRLHWYFHLENLLEEPFTRESIIRFPMEKAKKRASKLWWLNRDLLLHTAGGSDHIILCGNLVARAFRMPRHIGWLQGWQPTESSTTLWRFPHPSGLSRFWNDADRVLDAQAFLKRLVFEPDESLDVRGTSR